MPDNNNNHEHYPHDSHQDNDQDTKMTCDVLCSLGAAAAAPPSPSHDDLAAAAFSNAGNATMTISTMGGCPSPSPSASSCTKGGKSAALAACPKQHQLPMFLSKTYHMIDRCEPAIATWSIDGSNFVVKNVEKFASGVLPLYFKHSNFSSFARQLNFYGFRKLRTDPILTSDVDPRTACYVRFYHEKFQKDRPELLHQIKRATKSDQQSKDDVESLKGEVNQLKQTLGQLRDDTDRRLAEMSYECNRRITSMGAEYDKLAVLVHQFMAGGAAPVAAAPSTHLSMSASAPTTTTINGAPRQQQPPVLASAAGLRHNPHAAAIAAAAAVAAGTVVHPATTPAPAPHAPDLMQSLSQAAAISLERQHEKTQVQPAATTTTTNGTINGPPAPPPQTPVAAEASYNNKGPKRPAGEDEAMGAPPSKQPQQNENQHQEQEMHA